jgi:hypothetical protein
MNPPKQVPVGGEEQDGVRAALPGARPAGQGAAAVRPLPAPRLLGRPTASLHRLPRFASSAWPECSAMHIQLSHRG